MSNMSNFQAQNGFNPQQINPALLQVMEAQAQNQNNNAGGAFGSFHQMFQRLQSQEVQKLDQQRQIGLGMPQQQQQQQSQNPPGVPSGQQPMSAQQLAQQHQFLQMMQRVGMGTQSGQANSMSFGNGMQGSNQVPNGPGPMPLATGGQMTNPKGLNVHSQQQGLNLPGMPENEAGRRQMLQNMLTQQLQQAQAPQSQQNQQQMMQAKVQQFQQQQQQQQQQPRQFQQPQQMQPPGSSQMAQQQLPQMSQNGQRTPSLPQMQQMPQGIQQNQPMQPPFAAPPPQTPQNGQQGLRQPQPEQLREFIRQHPNLIPQLQRRHPNNQQAAINELAQMAQMSAMGMNQQASGSGGVNPNTMAPGQMQMPGNNMGSDPSRQGIQAQQPQLSPTDLLQQLQSGSGQFGGFDIKQVEALQAMKAAQQRGGYTTPQTSGPSNLPLMSPQPPLFQHQNQQTAFTGAMGSNPLSTPNLQQAPDNTQSSMSGPSGRPQQSAQPSQSSTGPSPGQNRQPRSLSKAAEVEKMLQSWSETQLGLFTSSVIQKLGSQPQSEQKFNLLQLIAEWKRRGLAPPAEAFQAAEQAFGNQNFIQQLNDVHWATLSTFAKQGEGGLSRTQDAMSQQMGQMEPIRQMSGSQGNPIEIGTPSLNGPSQYFNQTITGSQPLRSPLQMDGQNAGGSNQKAPSTNTWPQTSQGSQAAPSVNNFPQPKPRPWSNMDFRNEIIPMKESNFWNLLGNQHLKRAEAMAPPLVEGRAVNLYQLFILVHRNGGGAKIWDNVGIWQFLAGHLGFPPENGEQMEQPARASASVALQIRNLYIQYVQPFEDLFYKRLYEGRLKAAAEGQQPHQPLNPTNTPPLPPLTMTPAASAQLLQSMSKAQTPKGLEEQKRVVDEIRRQSQSSNGSVQPNAAGMQTPGRQASGSSVRLNPLQVMQWIKTTEDAMRANFPKGLRELSPDDKVRFKAEMKDLVPIAKDARSKITKIVMAAAERGSAEMLNVRSLINLYMFTFIIQEMIERDEYPFGVADIDRLKGTITKTLDRFSAEFLVSKSPSTPQRGSTGDASNPAGMANLEEIASKLPKGLRMEDLKPPPAKRQRGSLASRTSLGSPSLPGSIPTPPAKTPGGSGESPAPPGSAVSKSGGYGVKRKRESSMATTPMTPMGVDARKVSTPGLSMAAPALNNALGIDLDSTDADSRDPVLSSLSMYQNLQSLDPNVPSTNGVLDDQLWSTLMQGLEEYTANTSYPNSANGMNSANGFGSTAGASLSNLAGYTRALSNKMTQGLDPSTVKLGSYNNEEEWFSQFIDMTKVDEAPASPEPTPELYRPPSDENEGPASDLSPESIRTVGSSTFGKTPVAMSIGVGKTPASDALKNAEQQLTIVMGGAHSPETAAYNGSIFANFGDDEQLIPTQQLSA